MKKIEAALQTIDGYLISITRDTVNGWYEIQMGLPTGWVYDENEKIDCKVIEEIDAGSILKIAPKTHEIVIDDLILFVQVILKTNKKIAEKEKQFTNKMEAMKGLLEKEAKKFYQELDELREHSFKNDNEKFVENLEKPKRGRPAKKTMPTENIPETDKSEPEKKADKVIKTKPKKTTTVDEETTVPKSPKK